MISTRSLASSEHLINATRTGDLETVIELLKQGVDDIDDKTFDHGSSALTLAIEKGFFDITEQLLKYGAHLDSVYSYGAFSECSPLHIAAYGGNSAIVNLLLNLGVDVNARDEQGKTPLFWTVACHYYQLCRGKHRDIFEMLLNKGADINAKNRYGRTILHENAMNARMGEIGEFLLRYGADIESRDKNGCTPLHVSINKRGLDLKNILELDPNVNCRDDLGRTPLHRAVTRSTIKDIIFLLEYGADINLESFENEIPFHPLSDRDYKSELEMWQIFISHVAKLKAVDAQVSEKNIELVHSSEENTDFYNRCIEEMRNMKIKKVHDTDITFFDLLTKHLNVVNIYVINENVIKLYDYETNKKLKVDFPIYADPLNHHLCRAMIRRELVTECLQILWIFSNKLSLNNLETICSFLTVRDLKNFISAYHPELIHDFENRRMCKLAKSILPTHIYDD